MTPSPLPPSPFDISRARVLIDDLLAERDRNLLDLCREHVDRMTPPVGWSVEDSRVVTISDSEPALAV